MKIIVNFIKKLFKNSFMIVSIVKRDLKVRYIGSVMGFFWAFIHPLITTLIYTFVFSIVWKVKVQAGAANASTSNFPVWFLAGLLPWILFSETVSRSASIILENKPLITKTIFPSEVLPLTTLLANIVNHAIGLGILLGLMLITRTPFTSGIVLLPLYFLLLTAFTLGAGWFVASCNVYLRDVGHILPPLINVWFFATPIMYPFAIVPEQFKMLLKINPFYLVAEGYRSALIGGYGDNVHFSPWYVLYAVALSAAVLIIGGLVFRKLKWGFADVL